MELTLPSVFQSMSDKKTTLIIGVRNDRSIAFAIAKKMYEQGHSLAISYTEDTKEDVLFLIEKNNMKNVVTGPVDVRNEQQIKGFCTATEKEHGKINYILHAVAYGSHKVLCSKPPFSQEEAPEYIDIPLSDLEEAIDIGAVLFIETSKSGFTTPVN